MFALGLTQGSEIWKTYKKMLTNRISSTEMASVLLMNPYKSDIKLKLEKRGQIQKSDFESPAMMRGVVFEPLAIECFQSWTSSIFTQDQWSWRKPGLILDQDCLCCSPDAMVFKVNKDGEFQGIGYGLEVKVLYSRPIPKKKQIYFQNI